MAALRVRHDCDFTILMGKTIYTEKTVMHTLVQGLEDTSIARDIMKEYSNSNVLQFCVTLEKI